MNSEEEEFFSSLKKKKRRTSERSGEVLSSEDEALCEQQTPETSCAKRSTVSLDSCFGSLCLNVCDVLKHVCINT